MAPHFDKQYEDGVRSTLLPLEHLGNCQPSHHLKDSVIQGGRPFSNMMLLCICVCKYVSNGVRDYAITNARIWNNLFLPDMRLCDMFAWHCWHTQWNESPIHHLPQVTDCVSNCIIMLLSRILKACASRKAPFVRSVYFLTQEFQQACRMPASFCNLRNKRGEFV